MAQEQGYTDDKLGVLDMAKGAFKYAVMPQYQYMYNPGMYSMRHGIKGPGLSKNFLVTNPISKGIGSFISGRRAKAGGVSKYSIQKANKAMYTSARSFGVDSANNILKYIGLEAKDGYVGLKGGSIKEMGWWKSLKSKEIALKESRTNTNAIFKSIKNSISQQRGDMSLNSSLYLEAQEKLDSLAASKATGKSVRAARANLAKYSAPRAVSQSIINQELEVLMGLKGTKGYHRTMIGLKATRYLGTGALGASRLGFILTMGAAKLGAYAAGATLMYQAIKMVTNPIGQAVTQSIDSTFNKFNQLTRPELGGQLNLAFLSEGAYTERQRAVQAISRSRMNGRSILGSEAQYM